MKKQEQLSLFEDEIYASKTEDQAIAKDEKDQPDLIKSSPQQKEIMGALDPLIRIIQHQLSDFGEDFTIADRALLHKTFKQYLQTLVDQRYFTHIDLYFAEFIGEQLQEEDPRKWLGYWFLLLLVSRAYGLGHTALPYTFLEKPENWFVENDDPARLSTIYALIMLVFDLGELQLPASLTAPLSLSALREALSKVDLKAAWQPIIARVSMPLIRTEHGIYLDRNYQQETVIIDFFKKAQAQSLSNDDIDFVKQRLAHYFKTEGEINWQKFAAANAILNNVSVISGGPGTGKTTTVFKILQTLVDLHHQQAGLDKSQSFTILLAAPTGKAAARLSESILGQVRQLSDEIEAVDEALQREVREQLALIPYKGQTLHRLLMIHPFTRKPKFNQFNPLNFDVLVVDEASMIDQQMLVQLINALPKSGRVIFLGDKDQLSSVEAGAIMHELCEQENYSADHFEKLKQLMNDPFDVTTEYALVNPQIPAFNYLSFLKKSYRFKSDSALGDLAKLVNNDGMEKQALAQQYTHIKALFQDSEEALKLESLPIAQADLAKIITAEFKEYMKILPHHSGLEFAEKAFPIFNRLGVLSARRTGEYGALALNDLIRKTLFPRDAHREFFHGLPIMITHNSVENNLFNGDVGLILNNDSGTLSAYFEGVDSARVFSIHALPKFEPAFAMTIHKSQGSEFERILLFLGVESSAFLTKELFYTGITRAKKGVHIFANDGALKAALAGRVDRYSFIHARLQEE